MESWKPINSWLFLGLFGGWIQKGLYETVHECEETKHNHAHFFGRIIIETSPMAMDDDDDNDHTSHTESHRRIQLQKKN